MHTHTQHVVDMHTPNKADRAALRRLFTPLRAAFTLTFQHISGVCSGVITRQERRKIVECAF